MLPKNWLSQVASLVGDEKLVVTEGNGLHSPEKNTFLKSSYSSVQRLFESHTIYGICTCICHKNLPIVDKYPLHGWYGNGKRLDIIFVPRFDQEKRLQIQSDYQKLQTELAETEDRKGWGRGDHFRVKYFVVGRNHLKQIFPTESNIWFIKKQAL